MIGKFKETYNEKHEIIYNEKVIWRIDINTNEKLEKYNNFHFV